MGTRWLDRSDREPRMARMRGVRAPHRRTAHTAHLSIRGCAVGGANPAPPAHRLPPLGWGRVVRLPRRVAIAPQDRTIPPCLPGLHVIQRERPLAASRHVPDPQPPASGPAAVLTMSIRRRQ
jgi:hypothetical protein